jgi:hypothetical protein
LDGNKLTIAAVAGLAGLAALKKGSASRAHWLGYVGRVLWTPLAPPSMERAWVDLSWQHLTPNGETTKHYGITGKQLAATGALDAYWRKGHPLDSRLHGDLARFTEWVGTLQWPLTVYRGLHLREEEDYQHDHQEAQSWSADESAALRFIREGFELSPEYKGQLLTGVVPSPGDVAWADTLYFYLTYSLSDTPEHEVVSKAPDIIRIQEVRPRPDLLPPKSLKTDRSV